jgi:homoserine dehydrogenase
MIECFHYKYKCIQNKDMRTLTIGLLGYGTVGKSLDSLLRHDPTLTLVAIFRRKGKAVEDRMTEDAQRVVANPDIDTVVEVLGGLYPAYELVKTALEHGKNVVTANKALVNAYGDEFKKLASSHGVSFLFNAACGGGLPYLSSMIDSRSTGSISAVGGILNGTTNFMIDQMERKHVTFGEALAQAQALGYAEADPSGDVNGIDTLNKLRLALVVSSNHWVEVSSVNVEGIGTLEACDITFLQANGFKVRLLCYGQMSDVSRVAYVEPTLVNADESESAILENNNIAWFTSEDQSRHELIGQGAGGTPTAGNILRDLQHIQQSTSSMLPMDTVLVQADNSSVHHPYYIRHASTLRSSVLDALTTEKYVLGETVYRFTEPISVARMHCLITSFRPQHTVFFAGLLSGRSI